jgi:hypothetical protein
MIAYPIPRCRTRRGTQRVVTHIPLGEWYSVSAVRANIVLLNLLPPVLIFWGVEKKRGRYSSTVARVQTWNWPAERVGRPQEGRPGWCGAELGRPCAVARKS